MFPRFSAPVSHDQTTDPRPPIQIHSISNQFTYHLLFHQVLLCFHHSKTSFQIQARREPLEPLKTSYHISVFCHNNLPKMSKQYTTADVAQHKDEANGMWIIVDTGVYDITSMSPILEKTLLNPHCSADPF